MKLREVSESANPGNSALPNSYRKKNLLIDTEVQNYTTFVGMLFDFITDNLKDLFVSHKSPSYSLIYP